MPFEKGKSGNPGGRPKAARKLQDLAREHSEAALAALVAIYEDEKAPSAARVSAANAILDRAYGKPPQFNTGDSGRLRDALSLSDDELAAIAAGSERAAETENEGARGMKIRPCPRAS